jgi:hypothetical protein
VGSLDRRATYAEAKTAGFINKAVFRQELSERLGVAWTEARNGIAEIEGVPRPVIDAFSRRRAEIDAQVEAWGQDTARARQSAAVQTRKRKDLRGNPERLAPEWREHTARFGLDAGQVAAIVRRPDCARRVGLEVDLAARLISSDGITAERSSFDRRDAVPDFGTHSGHRCRINAQICSTSAPPVGLEPTTCGLEVAHLQAVQ